MEQCPPAVHHAELARRPYGTRVRKIHARPVRRDVVHGAPMALGEARDLHPLGRAEGQAAIRGLTDGDALQISLRVDVEEFLAVAAPHRLIAVARERDRSSQRADTLRTETTGRPDSCDTNASRRPFAEMRASRSMNDSFSNGRAGALESIGTAHASPPDTLTTRKPSADRSVGSQ